MHCISFSSLTFLISFLLPFTFATSSVLRSLDTAQVLHFTLSRRGGKLAPTVVGCDYVDLDYLAQELERTEARFNLTQRQVEGNKLVRRPKDASAVGKDEGALMGEVAEKGIWYVVLSSDDESILLTARRMFRYAKFKIGNPLQEIEVDLNMLVSDFYVLTTTSRRGSRYEDSFSQTAGRC